jgi:hypothetical protein
MVGQSVRDEAGNREIKRQALYGQSYVSNCLPGLS